MNVENLRDLADRFRAAVEPALDQLQGECIVKGEVIEIVTTSRGIRVALADRSTDQKEEPGPIPWIEAWLNKGHPKLKLGRNVRLAGRIQPRIQSGGRVRLVLSHARIVNKVFRRSAYRREQDRQLRTIRRPPRRELPWPIRTVTVLCGDGAAEKDFTEPLRRMRIQVKPWPINTKDAAAMAKAIQEAGTERVDLLALVRGGGDAVDLLPFDEPILAKAVAESPVPVLVGVGHRKDRPRAGWFALDSVATPSAAASRVRARAKKHEKAETAAQAKRHLDDLGARLAERSAVADRLEKMCADQTAKIGRMGGELSRERQRTRRLLWIGTPAAVLLLFLTAAGAWAARPYFLPVSQVPAQADVAPPLTVTPAPKPTRKPPRKRPAPVSAPAATQDRGAPEPALNASPPQTATP